MGQQRRSDSATPGRFGNSEPGNRIRGTRDQNPPFNESLTTSPDIFHAESMGFRNGRFEGILKFGHIAHGPKKVLHLPRKSKPGVEIPRNCILNHVSALKRVLHVDHHCFELRWLLFNPFKFPVSPGEGCSPASDIHHDRHLSCSWSMDHDHSDIFHRLVSCIRQSVPEENLMIHWYLLTILPVKFCISSFLRKPGNLRVLRAGPYLQSASATKAG